MESHLGHTHSHSDLYRSDHFQQRRHLTYLQRAHTSQRYVLYVQRIGFIMFPDLQVQIMTYDLTLQSEE